MGTQNFRDRNFSNAIETYGTRVSEHDRAVDGRPIRFADGQDRFRRPKGAADEHGESLIHEREVPITGRNSCRKCTNSVPTSHRSDGPRGALVGGLESGLHAA